MSSKIKHRKLNRLTGYDYSQDGYYFVTVCVKDRKNWLGEIRDNQMILNQRGRIVLNCWNDLPRHYPNMGLDEFIVMPNHVHGIIIIKNDVGNGLKPFPTKLHGLSEFIRAFKTFSSRNINKIIVNHERFRWQKSFHDHIIRNEKDLNNMREYIANNPLKWDEDINN
jgi:REP element-mobilizing transposase RayT